jgi:hypothetical protein
MFILIAENKTLKQRQLLPGTCHLTHVIYEHFGTSETGDQKHELLGALTLISRTKKNYVAHAPEDDFHVMM